VFMTEVDLIEGENSIMVIAKDDLGNEKAINRMIRLDTIAPILDRLEPPSGTHVTNPILQLHGEVYDEVGIGSVRGRVNDGPHQMISTQRNWTWVVTLEDGQNLLDLEVKDDAGNILFRQITYTLLTTDDGDTEPPTVVITEPRSNDSIETGILKVFGWALDDVGLASVEIRLDGGEWRPVTGLQSWEHEFDLMKGIYIIEVRAEDTSGNTAVDSIWVSVIIVDESQDDGKNEPSKWPLYFGLGVFLFLFTFLIGYLLFVRSSYREQQERMEYKGTGRGPIKGQRTVRTRERRRFPGEDGPLERPRGNRRRMDREEGS
ncbi:MAG: Ig-like domain-containing protein, partial [Candidatus Thermoplasmatota archaeon]|nr:Ig-like domain-containing protein [Candidatus Thermoplasmatota archaeon]